MKLLIGGEAQESEKAMIGTIDLAGLMVNDSLVLIPCLYVISNGIVNLFRRKGKKLKEIVAGT